MKKSLDDEILDLLSSSDRSLTISHIATALHHAWYTFARHLDTLLLTGMVSMRQHGSKKKVFPEKGSSLSIKSHPFALYSDYFKSQFFDQMGK